MEPELTGFAAEGGSGVSESTAIDSGSSYGMDAESGGGVETPASKTASGGTPSEPRMIPETDLNNLRSSLDRQVAQARAEARQYQQAMENLTQAFLEQRWQGMTPEEADLERAEYRTIQEKQRVEQEKAQLESLRNALNEQAKPIYAEHLSKKYGVESKRLLKFSDPATMEAAAQELSMVKSEAGLSVRKRDGVDRMDSGGGAGGPEWDGLRGQQLMDWYFKNKKRR